jgi:uncharacterized protein YgiB involved in biofilm formation
MLWAGLICVSAVLMLAGCSKSSAEEEFASEVSACMSAGGSHLECERKAQVVTCVRAGSRYQEYLQGAPEVRIHYRCSDGTMTSK